MLTEKSRNVTERATCILMTTFIPHLISISIEMYTGSIPVSITILFRGNYVNACYLKECHSMIIESRPIAILSANARYLRIKRVFDVLFSLLLLLPLCVVMLFVAILIKLDSKGPVLFRQERVGQNGVKFTLLKFRSMYIDSDESLHREAIKQYMNGEKLNGNEETALPYKLENDPRITRVGRFIRKTSIDELPQFFNVLHGEMTLVGPRPPLPYEVELYSPYEWLRLSGKPGLTGSWQVYGRSTVSFQSMVEMDINYLQQQSFWEDLKLIACTPLIMILGRGGA